MAAAEQKAIMYSAVYEYRRAAAIAAEHGSTSTSGCRMHVVLPPDVAKRLPKGKLLSEAEWRSLGVQQSRGWVHYAIHRPEPHIMLFRRPRGFSQEMPMGVPMVAGVLV
eukprot:scaffold7.g3426.t1